MNVNENVTFESKTEIPIACSLLSNIRCPSVLVKKQALIYLLNNADSLNYATETGDEGISERIVDSNDKYVLYDRPELDQPAKCLSMDITTRNVPTKSGHPSTLNYNFLKQAIKEDLGQVSVHNAYLFPQSSASLKKTNIFQSSKFKARELNKRVLSEDEFPSGDIYQQLMVSKMSTCHQKHKNKFYTSRASKLFTNHDYDCKLPSRRRNHTIQTKRFQLCSNFPRVNLFIPFHEVQEFQRIQYQKAAKHRIGRQTYLCTTQLVHWFLSLHIVRCNIFLPVDRDITLCTQSVVLQDMPAPLTLIVANASSAEVTSSNVPNETTHCSQMYCLITESRCHFSITNRCAFHELGQKQLCSIHPMIAFRESYVYFKTLIVVEYFTPSPIIQYKLFTSTVNSSKCESILFRKLLDVRQKQLQQKSLWTDWFYHSAMTTFSFIGASLSVNGLNSDDYSSFIGLLLALTTCGCICLYKNFSYTI
uniref:Uncharacterized protein n=1 Tax=Trichobilharzia regenti TaxID=157069 RepID=A0AA85IRJ1_TRIRE|nr:unnamed protein product [Trichobilharzia regenti]